MKCESCGNEIKENAHKDPWCMYQLVEGKIINKLFHPDEIPNGWYDSPKAARSAVKKTKKKPIPKATNFGLNIDGHSTSLN